MNAARTSPNGLRLAESSLRPNGLRLAEFRRRPPYAGASAAGTRARTRPSPRSCRARPRRRLRGNQPSGRDIPGLQLVAAAAPRPFRGRSSPWPRRRGSVDNPCRGHGGAATRPEWVHTNEPRLEIRQNFDSTFRNTPAPRGAQSHCILKATCSLVTAPVDAARFGAAVADRGEHATHGRAGRHAVDAEARLRPAVLLREPAPVVAFSPGRSRRGGASPSRRDPRPGRGAAATGLRGISTAATGLRGISASRPRRGRDRSPRNIHVTAAAVPRPVSADHPRHATGLRGLSTSRDRSPRTIHGREAGAPSRGAGAPPAPPALSRHLLRRWPGPPVRS